MHAPDGTAVGWLQVLSGGDQPAPVMYEAVLPSDIDEALAAALEEEIAWIQDHTLDSVPGLADRP